MAILYRINCGGSAASPFTADSNFSGGNTLSVANSIDTTLPANPAPQAVYQNCRYGVMSYLFTGLTPSAKYTVRLHFAELYWTASTQRQFNVAINTVNVLPNYDIVYEAGGYPFKATARGFNVTADSSGHLEVEFTNGGASDPLICGIEVMDEASEHPAIQVDTSDYIGGIFEVNNSSPTFFDWWIYDPSSTQLATSTTNNSSNNGWHVNVEYDTAWALVSVPAGATPGVNYALALAIGGSPDYHYFDVTGVPGLFKRRPRALIY